MEKEHARKKDVMDKEPMTEWLELRHTNDL